MFDEEIALIEGGREFMVERGIEDDEKMEKENREWKKKKKGNRGMMMLVRSSSIVVIVIVVGRGIDEKEEDDEKTRLEEAEGEKRMDLAESWLMKGRERGEKEGEAEEFIECPKWDEWDKEETDCPEGIEALKMVGGSGFETEMEDEGEREKRKEKD